MKAAEEVFQFKVPRPPNPNIPDGDLRYTFVYALGTGEAWVLIDAGADTDEGLQALRDQWSRRYSIFMRLSRPSSPIQLVSR